MENSTVPAVQNQDDWKNKIEAVRNTIAHGATDDEFQMFVSVATSLNLNPFTREIWCINMGGRTIIMTSRDGYLKIANSNQHYRGIKSDAVYSGDKFLKDDSGVHHAYNVANRGHIVGAYALVYRDDRTEPAYFFAPFNEYNKGSGTWKQYPHAMIVKVAESMALKRAFSVSGLVSEDEINTTPQTQQQPQASPQTPAYSQNERNIQLRQLWERYLAVCDNQKDHAMNAMKKITGKSSSKDYTHEDIQKLFEDVIRREDELISQEQDAGIQDADFQEAMNEQEI